MPKRLLRKDLAIRAVLTFIQALVASLLVLDEPLTTNAVIASLASAGSVVWHQVLVPAYEKLRK